MKIVTVSALVILAFIFVFQNAGVVELRFLFWSLSMSRALMAMFLFLIGVSVGWLFHGHLVRKKSKSVS
jgi:uncharacterized integral membrane protein